MLAIGATLARETRQEAEDARGQLPYLETIAQAVGEQPLLIGSRQIAETLRSPGAVGERTIGAALGSFVPTAISDVAEAIDPTQRDARGLAGPVTKRIPGLRQTLPEATDVLGQARQDLGPVQAMIDPTRATQAVEEDNPLFAELVRLDAGVSGFRQKPKETPDAYRSRVQEFGRLYGQFGLALIASPRYQAADDDERRAVIGLLNARVKSLFTDDRATFGAAQLQPGFLFQSLRHARQRQQVRERREQRRR